MTTVFADVRIRGVKRTLESERATSANDPKRISGVPEAALDRIEHASMRIGTADPAGGFNVYLLDEPARVHSGAWRRGDVAARDAGAIGDAGDRVALRHVCNGMGGPDDCIPQ